MRERRRQRASHTTTSEPTPAVHVTEYHEPPKAKPETMRVESVKPTATPRTRVADKPAPPKVRTFKNEYLSVSRIRKYAQCPQAFRFSYIDKLPRGVNVNLAFGSLAHLTFEAVNRWAMREKLIGPIPADVVTDAFRAAWKACELSDEDLYQEGLDVVREWYRANPEIDATRVLGIEQRFEFVFEGRRFLGFIDRIDKIDDETLLVRDYKTNRIVFTNEETEADIQLSVYENAARLLYPWAKRVELGFDMVRHGFTIRTTRSHGDVVDALHYCIDTAEKSETDTEYAPRLNVYCAWCDHLDQCEAFKAALADKQEFVAITQDDELEKIATERERLVLIGKAVEGKRKALDRLITARLKAGDETSLTAHGVTYKLGSRSSRSYPVAETLAKLVRYGNITEDDARKVLSISPGDLDEFVKGLALNRAQAKILKVNLDSVCVRGTGSRYLDARPVKGTKK